MLPEFMQGTRTKQNFAYLHPCEQSVSGSLTRDVGMSKLVTGVSLTFVNGATNQIQGANGTFTGKFVGDDMILVEGTNLNNGIFTVTAIDAVNGAFLTCDNGIKAEGPITTATVRSL